MNFKAQYVWPSATFPFRHYYSGKNLDIFFISNIFHNFEWLEKYRNRISDRHFFFSITGWHIDEWGASHSAQMFDYLKLKKENFFILANNEVEKQNLEKNGFICSIINQNAWIDEELIKPSLQEKQYNAIMIARKTPFKRHYLASKIPKLALISGGCNLGAQLEDPLPNCVFESKKHLFEREVCEKISQSSCGLCLSKIEGACFSSSEYLLCGVPVVSTQSQGGRDYWYDSYNSLICDDNEESVAAAVDFFVKTPRDPEKIRNTHIEKQKQIRAEFISILQSVFSKYNEEVNAERYFLDNFENKMYRSLRPDFDKIFPLVVNKISYETEPKDIYLELFSKYKNDSKIFLESGTFRGGSVYRALTLGYDKIISIEPHLDSYLFSADRFKNNKNVELVNNFSENVLDKIIYGINEKCLIFLDGAQNSWFKEGTQPLKQELEILSKSTFKNHTIIIDDYSHIHFKEKLVSLLFDINSNYKFDFYSQKNGILVAYLENNT
jgi:glycosyltransferase involved in cell wall biosynthesis